MRYRYRQHFRLMQLLILSVEPLRILNIISVQGIYLRVSKLDQSFFCSITNLSPLIYWRYYVIWEKWNRSISRRNFYSGIWGSEYRPFVYRCVTLCFSGIALGRKPTRRKLHPFSRYIVSLFGWRPAFIVLCKSFYNCPENNNRYFSNAFPQEGNLNGYSLYRVCNTDSVLQTIHI